MYGHQVIEGLKNNPHVFGADEPQRLKAIQDIKNSQHFFMGDVFDIVDLFAYRYAGEKLFAGSLATDINLPFDNICLSFVVSPEEKLKKCYKNKSCVNQLSFDKVVFLIKKNGSGDGFSIQKIYFTSGKWLLDNSIFEVIPNIAGEASVDINFNGGDLSEMDVEKFVRFSSYHLFLINFSIMLLNTKNIVTKKHNPPVKLNKKRIKKGKQPLFTYHTLRLQLPGKSKSDNGRSGSGDNTTRLHLCRGHFKTYTEVNPLFGRFTGRYWWQPHVRGDKTKGVVMKDYAVETASV